MDAYAPCLSAFGRAGEPGDAVDHRCEGVGDGQPDFWAPDPPDRVVTVRRLSLRRMGLHDCGHAKGITRMRAQAIVALIAGMVLAVPAGATMASAAPETFLVLGVASHGQQQFVTLLCDPASGTHPRAEAACNALLAAGGDIDKVAGQPDTLCPDIYDPVTATASGHYQGVSLIYRRSYPNHCELDTKTAPLFQF